MWNMNIIPARRRPLLFSPSSMHQKINVLFFQSDLPKKVNGNIIFLALSGKMVFLFPKNITFHFVHLHISMDSRDGISFPENMILLYDQKIFLSKISLY